MRRTILTLLACVLSAVTAAAQSAPRDATYVVRSANGTLTNETVLATSADLAGLLSDETGSGAATFATAPTLNTPVLNTPTINGATVFGHVRFGFYEPGGTNNPRVLTVTDVLENGTIGPYATAFFDNQIRATDYTFDTGITTLNLRMNYGYNGVPTVGTGGPLNSVLDVNGQGSARSEPATRVERLNVNIGTGFTQSVGPVGRIWFADEQLLGPRDVQPSTLNGPIFLIKNSYNGSPSDSPSAASWLVTAPNTGAEAARMADETYPVNVGLGIVGYSRAHNTDGVGFTVGLQIGGSGSAWGESKSIVGTGADVSQYQTRGIYVHGGGAATLADVEAPTFTATPRTVAALPACSIANQGRLAFVTDSTTNVWGAIVTGFGAFPVGVSCNGTQWTVFSK